MSEDRELKAMATVYSAMEPLEADERQRVWNWLGQKLSIQGASESGRHSKNEGNTLRAENPGLSTDTIATVLGANSGADLIMAAAAHLHFSARKQKFSRQELTEQMRSAPGHFKETYINNLSTYLTGLTKADRLRLVAAGTYALSVKERQNLEPKLANAG